MIDPKIKEMVDSLTMSLDRFVGEKATPATFKGIKAQIEESAKVHIDDGTDFKPEVKMDGSIVEVKASLGLKFDKVLLDEISDFKKFSSITIHNKNPKDADGVEIMENDIVVFVPKSESVANKCKKLKPNHEYKVSSSSSGSVCITHENGQRSYYRSSNFRLKEKYKSDLMKAIEGL